MSENSELTPKQRLFCREYVKDFNGTQAAIRAGYSKTSATSTASEILTYPQVIEELSKLTKKMEEKIEVSAERILNELVKMGFSDIHNYIDNDWKLKNLEDIGENHTPAIKEVSVEEITMQYGEATKTTKNVKFKLHDKLGALEKLAKHINFYQGDAGKAKETVIRVVKDAPPKKE